MSLSVGQVAGVSGVTVRTLHHYDEIGLLSPGERSPAGYRLYNDSDLERLERILFYKELGFPLEDIVNILSDPKAGTADHLRRQHQLLSRRIGRLQAMVSSLEYEMEAQQMGISLTPEERIEIFGDFLDSGYAEEAEERWGGTEPWKESQRKAASYGKADWLRIRQEGGDLERRFVEAMEAGVDPDSPEAMDLAEEHRGQITKWFYECSFEIHRGLGQMYVDDPRFKARYDGIAPGLAEYSRDAFAANAERHGK
ncbi:MAG TPA: MerR family transcriptional regulator [Actinomycetota bacterium]|nr:MerR family transcriptional regulator [Actinomycetota bacterium]